MLTVCVNSLRAKGDFSASPACILLYTRSKMRGTEIKNGRPNDLQVFAEFGNRAVIGDGRTAHHRQVVTDGALEGVRQRQEREKQVMLDRPLTFSCEA